MKLAIVLAYLGVVLWIGLRSGRRGSGTGEDWFLATRSIGPFVLLMTLFGTHMTAFSLLGASGQAYRKGIGVFALMASSSAIVAPIVFRTVGMRLWAIGKRHGYRTQVQFFRERFESHGLGSVLFVVLLGLLVPYLLVGVMGSGIALHGITSGAVPEWVGSLLVCAVVTAYVTRGGLRGTAWANTFQTLVFLVLGILTYFWIVRAGGGLGEVFRTLERTRPEMLVRGEAIPIAQLATYALVPLSVGMFPHIFMHWLTARDAKSFRWPVVGYPLCIAAVWVPSVLLGVIGRALLPDVPAKDAGNILVQLIDGFAPAALGGLLAAGVFAAIMSSLDSQTLAIGTMFTHDVAPPREGGGAEVRRGRMFVVVVLVVTWLLSLVAPRALFRFGIWSFSGFAALVPLVVAAVYWKRATRAGAFAGLVTAAVGWALLFADGHDDPGYTIGGSGVMPVAVLVAASSLAVVVVSWCTAPPSSATIEKFFPDSEARA